MKWVFAGAKKPPLFLERDGMKKNNLKVFCDRQTVSRADAPKLLVLLQ
jgi:hypothetical protein